MKRYIPLLLIPAPALAHPGHDIEPTPQGLSHAAAYADHLAVILGAAGLALIVVAAVTWLRSKRRSQP